MDIGRILPGIAILSGQVAPHQGHDWDDNRQRRFIGGILSGIELFLRLRFPCLKLEYDRVKCFSRCKVLQRKEMVKVKRLALFAFFLVRQAPLQGMGVVNPSFSESGMNKIVLNHTHDAIIFIFLLSSRSLFAAGRWIARSWQMARSMILRFTKTNNCIFCRFLA